MKELLAVLNTQVGANSEGRRFLKTPRHASEGVEPLVLGAGTACNLGVGTGEGRWKLTLAQRIRRVGTGWIMFKA